MAMFRMFKGGRSSVIHALRCSMCNRIVSGRVVMRSRRGKGELVAAEFGRPLFKECADPFATILREITANLFLDLLSQRQSQFFTLARKQSFFDGADRERRALRSEERRVGKECRCGWAP